jgi:hypothetical protein
MSLGRYLILVLIFLTAQHCVQAQIKESWQRVYTGAASTIEVNASSLRLEPHVIRADFRTVLSKPESIGSSQGVKYKSRIETISFKTNDNRFRLDETIWIDAKGATLQTYKSPPEQEWRIVKPGGIMERLAFAATGLPPFGRWKIDSLKSDHTKESLRDLQKLVGSRVMIRYSSAQVGSRVCSSISYEYKEIKSTDFERDFDVRLSTLGINDANVETISLTCEGNSWLPPKSMLVRVKDEELVMLWQGVFFVLKREKAWTGQLLPPYTRTKFAFVD